MDNENLELGFNAPGIELIERAFRAVDTLTASMNNFASAGPALRNITTQVEMMQASMTTGFKEIEARIDKFQDKVKKASQTSMQAAMDEERWINAKLEGQRRYAAGLVEADNKAMASLEKVTQAKIKAATVPGYLSAGAGWWEKELAAIEKSMQAQLAARADSYAKQKALQQQQDVWMHDQRTKEAAEVEKSMQSQLAARADAYSKQRMLQQQQDIWLHEQRTKEAASIEKAMQAQLAARADAYAKQKTLQQQQDVWMYNQRVKAAADEERIRISEAKFSQKSPGSQLSIVNEARAYIQGGGTNATGIYGATAAGIAASTAEYKKLEQAAKAATGSVQHHNEAMKEGHAFARGLSGALGTLWITYGSLAPLLAGAAIAGSLRKVYEAGKDVEYQLAFVKALSEKPVDLEKFLGVTEGTVVSVKAAAEGMRALAQNGLDANTALAALPAVLNLATIGELSVADAALSATGVLAAFNMEVSQIERVGDIFAKAAATSNTSVAGMTESMKTASTASALFGVSIEETAASIGILAKLNITGSAAGTSFRNILKDLYEPTKKQGDAMARLGITTRDSNDGLKGYVQILSEIREKTAGLSEGGRLNFLSQISDERGAKALIATLNNWDEFTKKIEEAKNASGFMQKSMIVLEDTVEGASKRMANNFQNTFIKAFTSAAPIIQATMTELGDLAKSEGFIKFLSGAAEGVANLTRFIIEHADAITNLVMAYAAFKGIGYIVASYNALAVAMGTSTVAATAEALATRASTVAKAAFTTTTAAAFPVLQMDAVAKVESTVASRALATANTTVAGSIRLIMMALGPIALAIGAVVVAYELFIKRAEESDKELLKQSNTLNVINEDLDRQIEKLKTRNELWDPGTLQFKETQLGGVDDVLKKLKDGVTQAELALSAVKGGGLAGGTTGNAVGDAIVYRLELKRYQDTLDVRKEMLATALKNESAMRAKEADLNVQKSVDSFRAEQERLKKEYEAFINLGTAKSHTGALMASPAQQAVYGKAEGLIPNVFGAKTQGDIDNLRNSLTLLKGEANSVSESFDKIDTKGLNEAYRSSLNQASAAASTYTKAVEGDLARARSSYDAGTIGSIQLINAEAAAARNMAGAKAEAATISATLAAKEGKQDDYEKYLGQRQTAEAEFTQTYITQAQRLADAKIKIEAETTKTLVAELEARGEYVKAEDIKLEQGFTLMLKRMNADLQSLGAGGQSGTPLFAALLAQADQAEQEMRARRQAAQQKEYEATAKGILDQAEIIKNGVAATLDTLNQRASEGAGIFDREGIEAAANALTTQAIPGYQALIEKAKELAKESPDLGGKAVALLEKNLAAADKQVTKLQKSLTGGMFKELARNFDAMGESFKGIADAVYGVGVALENLALISEKEKRGDKVSMQERIGGYGDMAAAASKAFKEETGGYQALSGVAKAFHAAQLVMNLASTASGVIAGAAQMFAQSGWGGFAGVAAMAGVMGTLGYAIGGGFNSSAGGKSAADMQKEQGTGSVFGNASAKSESLTKSIEILEKNSNLMLPVNQGMLSALRNIEASMVGLTNLVVRTPGVMSGENMGIQTGTISKSTGASIASGAAMGAAAGTYVFPGIGTIIGGLVGAAVGAAKSIWGKTKQNIVDAGLQFGGSLSELQSGKGFNQYASVDTTTSSWFGLVKKTSNAIQTQGISSELSQQFGLIFTNLEDALKAASGSLGSTATNVETALNSLSIATTSVSLKGLTGQALTDALNSVISKAMDEIATAALPGLDAFRKVGEGYAETVMRVASGVESAKLELELLGITAVKFSEITNKQGDVGAEIVRQSIVLTEQYQGALTGVGEIMSAMPGTASDLAKSYKELLDVRTQMTKVGLQGTDLSVALIKGAGGTSELSTGLKDFFSNFFTDAERAKAESEALAKQFAAIGVAMPTSREKFRELVETTGTSTDASAKLTGQLLNLAGAFASVSEATAKTIQSTEDMVAASERKDKLAASRAKDLADEVVRKAADDAFTALTESVKTGLQGLLRAGKGEAALASVMSVTKINSAQYTNPDGSFNAGGYNAAAAKAEARISKDLINQASADAINVENVSGLMSGLMSNILNDDMKNSLIRDTAERVKLPAGGLIYQALSGLLEAVVDQYQNENMLPGGQGIASVQLAARNLRFASYNRGMPSAGIGADVNAYGESLVNLSWLLKNGKITTEEYGSALAAANKLIGDNLVLVGDQAAQIERVNKAQESLRQAGLDSISYYFGEIGKSVEQLAVAAEAAKTPLALTVQSIGRLASLADVMAGSVAAATYNGANTDNLSVVNADIVAKAAAIAASVMTTSDAAAAAKVLAEKQSFSGVGGTQLRDISMIMDGLKQYDSISFEATFMKLNNALAKGVVTQAQYQDIFQQSLAKYKGEDVLSAAATATAQLTNNMVKLRDAMGSFADEILIDKSKTTLNPQATLSETMRQYEVARAVAMSAPDDTSITRFKAVANQLLDVNKYSTQAEYNAAFGKIYGDARNMEDLGARSAGQSREQQIIDQLEDVNGRLDNLQDVLLAALVQIAKNTKDTANGVNVSNLP